MSRGELLKGMLAASETVCQLVEGRISMQDFIRSYDDYYYAAALDGHEDVPDLRELINSEPLVGLHAEVQRILNLMYSGPEKAAYESAGRIDAEEARRRVVATAEDRALASLVDGLRAQVSEDR